MFGSFYNYNDFSRDSLDLEGKTIERKLEDKTENYSVIVKTFHLRLS